MKKFTLLGIIFGAGVAAVSCGGGGGESVATNPEPPITYQGTYKGAATVGDSAEFSVNGNVLTYKVSGPVLGNENGTLTLQPLNSYSNNHYWYAEKNGSKIYIFIAENLGLAYVENIDGQGRNAIIVGLRNIGNVTSIVGKTFNYIYIPNNLESDQTYICRITINGNSTDIMGNFTYECSNGMEGLGCWKYDANENVLNATADIDDCSNWDGSNPTYRIIAKPIENGKAGFIVDYTNGAGVGIGTEAIPYNSTNFNNLSFNTLDVDNLCPAIVNVANCTSNGICYYTYSDVGSNCSYKGEGKIYLNAYCLSNGTILPKAGIFCAYNEADQTYYNGFFDITGKYYVATQADDPTYFEIGALDEIK